MITLDLPPKIEKAINFNAQQAGLSVENYLLNHIQDFVNQQSSCVTHFVLGKTLNSFAGNPVEIQKAMRDE